MFDFSALHIALSGLGTDRPGVDDDSHDSADAAAERYTRLRIELAARYPHQAPFGWVLNGAEIEEITWDRESFLNGRFRADADVFSRISVRADLLAKAEGAFGEPGSGITGELSALWSTFAHLAVAPRDTGARRAVLTQLESTAGRVRSIADGLSDLAVTASCSLEATVTDVNEILHQVASLNHAGPRSADRSATDSIEHRDVLLDELSSRIGVNAITQPDGSVGVILDGVALVSGQAVAELTFDATTCSVMHPTGVELSMGGEARGFQTFLRDDVGSLAADLDAFVVALADTVNTTHSAGWVSDTEQGGDLLMYDVNDPAKTLSVAATDARQLATAASAGPPFPAFDGGCADALSALRTVRVASGGADTLEEALWAIVADLIRSVAAAESACRRQAASLVSSDRVRLTTKNVPVDEELIMGLEQQRIYEAAIRVMASIDETLEALVYCTGAVGEQQ